MTGREGRRLTKNAPKPDRFRVTVSSGGLTVMRGGGVIRGWRVRKYRKWIGSHGNLAQPPPPPVTLNDDYEGTLLTSWPEEAWQPVKLATTTNDHRKTNPTVKPGKPAIEEQAPADELSPLIFSAWDPGRRNVTRYDSEDAARAAALKHARCEAYACFPRGRGAGLARLEVQAPTDREDSDWLAPHDLPADD